MVISSTKETSAKKDIFILSALTLVGGVLAYVDHQLGLKTLLPEIAHGLVITVLLIACLISQSRHPEIKQLGWTKIVWGIALLTMAAWMDVLDEFSLFEINGIPFERSWEQAFIEKILGYTVGIGLVAFGFFQWVPWMIQTRINVQKLNSDLSRLLMSLDDHVEFERLNISRELHDDVAQRLTFMNYQTQFCRKAIDMEPDEAKSKLKELSKEISDTLKTVRQISRDLRPEALYSLGFVAALEEFLEKQRYQMPALGFNLTYTALETDSNSALESIRLEKMLDDRALLHLFRVIQEGVRNAMKHSKAKEITIVILELEDSFCLSVEDDGKGLPWKAIPSDDTLIQQGHLGIAGLKERVNELGGQFQLNNKKDSQGAKMEIIISK